MIDIKDISGSILKSVLVTQECKSYNELMSLCYITLSWEDDSGLQLPAGAYIEYGGNVYRLLEPYNPTYVNEASWRYTPQFYDKIAIWSKKPLFLVTDSGEETDWSLTAYPGQFMEAVVAAIQEYTGETYTYSVDASIAQLSMQNVTFQNVSIFDGLTKIANAWNTEWWVSGNVIHLSKCQYGTEITLTVGDNIGIPNVTKNKDGYFTRFYAFGGTRNITQDYNDSGFTNGLVNKRLTLSPTDYPGGYIDIKPNLQQAEIFVKTLIFDDIYPSSSLTISDVRAELKDYINEDGSKIQIGEDEEGNPLYQQYAIWYFKIPEFDFNNSTYDKEDNPDGMLLPGLALSVSFESGQLNGRDFELIYHDDTSEYEIKFVTEGTLIVPGTVSLIPADGDSIILYNIKMPAEYTASAQEELAEALLSEMDKYKKDRNSYTFPSASDKFESGNLDMNVGQSVNFVRGSQSLSTRVLKVEKQIDYPIEQTITVGEEKIKGNTQEIKEEIVDANQNIDIATELANLSKAITDGYGRVQQLIMQSISQYRGLWYLDQHDAPNDPTKWTINTDYTAFSAGDFVAYATAPFDQLEPQLPVASDYNTTGLFRAKQGGGLLYDSAANAWYVDPDFQGGGGGIDEEQLAAYLTNNKYVTQKYLTDNGYLKLSSPLTGYQKPSGYSPITATDTLLSAIGKLEANFGNYVDLTTNQTVGGVKTFTERILSQKDVVAYAATDDGDLGLPVAGYSTTGLVRIKDGGGIVVDSSGVISVDPDYAGGGGVNFTPGNALQLTSSGVLNVLIGTTSGTVCAGNDSRLSNDRPNPYSLSWSGYSSGSYDGSSAKSISIPSNTSQLTNGAGFIKDGNGNFTTLSGSGSSSKYLAGNGTFYTIAYSELSGTPNLDIYVTLNTTQTITAQKTFTNRVWFNGVGMLYAGPSSNVHLVIGTGSGNVINGYTASESIGNIYFNYRSGSQYTRIDASNNFATAGDVVAYSTGSSLSDFVPVATSSTYGLVKYDGSTIGKNSSGQLYVIGGTSGGGGTSVSWSSITGKPSWIGSSKPSYSWSEISGKPSWIGSSKPSYSWSEISSKPTIISSIGYSNTGSSGSGKVVTKVTASGSTVYVTYGNDQTGGGGSSFTLASASFSSNIVWSCSSSSYSIQIRRTSNYTGTSISGNTVNGLSGSSWSLGNLYLNYKSGSVNVRIDNSGRLYINGSQVTSDIRLKSIVGYEKNVLDRIMRIPVIHYTRTDLTDGMEYTGFSAQSFIGVFRNVTFLNEDSGYYGINEGAILGIAFQGLKELYARFRPVENRVKVLEQRVRNLQLRLDNAYREIFNLKQGKEEAA